MSAGTEAEISVGLQRGNMGMRKIARHVDRGQGTVQRIAREMAV
jgi:Helix-turn-helix domain